MMPPLHRRESAGLGYSVAGTGPERVLVLHDWTASSRGYTALRRFLDRTRFTYVFPDLRGFGRSGGLAGAWSHDEISRDCGRLMDRLGWGRCHVVGHSMTGAAVQRIALDHGPRIRSLTAICPMSAAGSPAGPEAKAFFRGSITDDDAFRRLVRFVSPGLPEACVELKLRHNRRASPEARKGYLDMFWHANFQGEVQGLPALTLVVIGDRDPGLDAAAMEATFLRWHANAQLCVLGDCGHFPMLEQPEALAAVLEAFLRRHAG